MVSLPNITLPTSGIPFVGKAKDGEGECSFFVSNETLENARLGGHEFHFFDGRLLGRSVANPTAIYHGLNRAGFHNAWCYVAVPEVRYSGNKPEDVRPFPSGFVFIVTAMWVGPDPFTGYFSILDWEVRESDQKRPGFPSDTACFKVQKWPRP